MRSRVPNVTLGPDELMLGREIFELKEYITRVDYRVEGDLPKWDSISKEAGK